MKETFIAASIQMVSGTDVHYNLDRAAILVGEAAAAGAQLIALPEYFCLMGQHETHKVTQREPFGQGPIQTALADLARRHRIWLVGGTVPLVSPINDKVYNTSLLFNPNGEVVARYDKIHLFGFLGQTERYCESNTILAGKAPIRADTDLASLALAICYDLRFPELFRALLPFDLIVISAAFTAETGEAHWEPLLRSRAIENQCYVIASAQGGAHQNGRTTHGYSMIVDPWGRVLAQRPQGEGVITALIDLALIQSVRQRLPALSHRVLA